MTWTNLNQIVAGLNKTGAEIIAAFQGRTTQYTVSTFFGVTSNNLDVQFVDQSASTGGPIVAWAWSFGDGATSTVQNPTHTYDFAGDYLVSLLTTDSSGAIGSFSAIVTAIANPDVDPEDPNVPTAGFTVTTNGLVATFTDTSTDVDGTVVGWTYNFGEGPTALFTYVPTGLSVAFTDASTKPAPLTLTAWLWSFGDGSTSTLQNPTHVYAAGGNYTVTLLVTASNGNTDTLVSNVSVTSGATLGIPLGCTQSFTGQTTRGSGSTRHTLCMDGVAASYITTRIKYAADNGLTLLFNMTGGAHSDYLTNNVFDSSKWTAKMNTFNTTAIKASVASGVAQGVILGNSVCDEPFHHSWGPSGTFTKKSIDRMAAYVKSIFTTLPVGVFHSYQEFEPNSSYTVIDFIIAAYWTRYGDPQTWLNSTLSMANRDHHQVVFGENILDGGTFVKGCVSSGNACCPQGTTEGPGTFQGADHYNCRAIPSQMTTFARLFGPHGSGYMMWRYDAQAMSTGSWAVRNQQAFQEIKDFLDAQPARSWRRTD